MHSLPPFPQRIESATLDWRDDAPVSRAFDDIYFSQSGGLDEATHVFLHNNELLTRFSAGGFRVFTIGETGFGTGLNFLVAARAFLALAPADAILHFVSAEKFPLTPDDLSRTHRYWPELAPIADELRELFPPACSGFHRRVLCKGRVHLTLLLGDATALLARLDARIDAWFLDGFAPAKNSDLWTTALFGQMAWLSAPATTVATFTAAGDVKRGLIAAGFTVEKVAGFGRKRDMLRGIFVGNDSPPTTNAASSVRQSETAEGNPQKAPSQRRAAIIGGGLAGCATARALAERGWQVTLFERNSAIADETSGNIAGAVYPKFSVHETAQNRWYRDSYLFAISRLPQIMGAADGKRWSHCGLLQLPERGVTCSLSADSVQEVLNCKHIEIAESGRWPDSVLQHVDAVTASTLAGAELPAHALWFPGAAWVNPPSLCEALASHANVTLRLNSTVEALTHADGMSMVDGEHFDVVVVANAFSANTFSATAELPLRRVRGQVTHVAATTGSSAWRAIVCHEGYVTPARNGEHCIGATFAPRNHDPAVRAEDHDENLRNFAQACPAMYAALEGPDCVISGGRTGFRTQTPDYLPVIGRVADSCAEFSHGARGAALHEQVPRVPGVYILAALGAKGIAFSLLGAEIIAAMANSEPLPVDCEVANAIDPARFLLRARRRQPR